MRKIFFLVAIAGFGAWYLKNNTNFAGDDHTRMVGFSLPTMGVGQVSGIVQQVTSFLQTQTAPAPAVRQAPAAGQANVSQQYGAIARAGQAIK